MEDINRTKIKLFPCPQKYMCTYGCISPSKIISATQLIFYINLSVCDLATINFNYTFDIHFRPLK